MLHREVHTGLFKGIEGVLFLTTATINFYLKSFASFAILRQSYKKSLGPQSQEEFNVETKLSTMSKGSRTIQKVVQPVGGGREVVHIFNRTKETAFKIHPQLFSTFYVTNKTNNIFDPSILPLLLNFTDTAFTFVSVTQPDVGGPRTG